MCSRFLSDHIVLRFNSLSFVGNDEIKTYIRNCSIWIWWCNQCNFKVKKKKWFVKDLFSEHKEFTLYCGNLKKNFAQNVIIVDYHFEQRSQSDDIIHTFQPQVLSDSLVELLNTHGFSSKAISKTICKGISKHGCLHS